MERLLIEECARLSDEVYDKCIEVGDLGFTVSETSSVVIIAIRGTANRRNVERDINVIPYHFKGGMFSTWGFVRAYKKLEGPVLQRLPKNKPVIFTGHSLGGAVATLFAERIGVGAITFGSPRVYLRGWYKSTVNHFRVYMDDDPIPKIPAVLYCHKTEGNKIKDADKELIEVSDHFMDYYLKNLYKLWQ